MILIDAYKRHDWLVGAVDKRLREEFGKLQVAPDLLLHPVFDEAEALAGVPHREVVHPIPAAPD